MFIELFNYSPSPTLSPNSNTANPKHPNYLFPTKSINGLFPWQYITVKAL